MTPPEVVSPIDRAVSAGLPPRIPFNKPFVAGKELFYISQAVLHGNLAGDGRFTKLCSEWMEEQLGVPKILLTHSCTAALEMCALLCDVGPGDEVIMPSYTFVSTANAFALRGASIRFVDIRPDTLNLDETLVEAAINERTKAIVPVHYAGVGAEMDAINEVAAHHDLMVIEDAAQGVNATYKGRYLGTLAPLATYSFHETKNLIAGEGGAPGHQRRAPHRAGGDHPREGHQPSRFFRGQVDKYTWVALGSSYLASELTAAFLYGQLEATQRITRVRREIFSYYADGLADLERRELLRLPVCPEHCGHNAHMFYLLLRSEAERAGLIAHLAERNIQAVFHYVPLHTSDMGLKVSSERATLPVTDDLSERLLRLPCYFELTTAEQDRVIGAVREYLGG